MEGVIYRSSVRQSIQYVPTLHKKKNLTSKLPIINKSK